MALPLEGVTVLDLTTVMAGPYCTMVLGDMGATVIKVENFPEGDGSRRFEPKVNGESYCFAVLNRNKKSIGINMKDPRGKAIFMKLAAKADIITENFRPGVVKKLGIDYAAVSTINPGVIYASMSGFGQTGPYGHKGGFDIVAQGMSGIMMMTGEPGGRPAKVGIAMNDIASGVTALYSILGAYIGKLRHGKGQYVETSLLEAGLAWTHWESGAFFGGGEEPLATGTRHRRSTPYQAYKTATSPSAPTTTSCGAISATSPATNRSGLPTRASMTCRHGCRTSMHSKSKSKKCSPPIRRRTGSKNWMRHRCPADRSLPTSRFSVMRTSRRATWWLNMTTRKSAA